MALIKCTECKTEISKKAKTCPKCGAPVKKKTSRLTWLVTVLLVIVAYNAWYTESNLTPAQKEARKEQRKIEKAQEEAERIKEAEQKAEKEKEDRRKGFHCLSSWDGSHRAVKKAVEESARDPDSFEHIETRITPVDAEGNHKLVMRYRAANVFGGLSVGQVTATIDNQSCQASDVTIN